MGDKTFRQKSNVMMPQENIKSHANRTDTFQRAQVNTAPESKLSGLVQTLNSILPEVAGLATHEVAVSVEEDKVKQHQAAMRGERPSEDATKAGLSAHRAVDSRNQVNASQRELRAKAQTFEGTDDEWDEIVSTTFTSLLESTGGTPEDMAVTGEMWREQLTKVESIRFDSVQKQDQQNKYVTHHTSLLEATTASTTEEELDTLIGIASEEAIAMGMTSGAQEQAFLDAAVTLANTQDDPRLLDYAKRIGVYDRSPALQQAEKSLESRVLVKRQGERAREEYNYEEEAYLGKFKDYEEFTRELEKSDLKHTSAKMRQLWSSAERRKNEDHTVELVAKNMLGMDIPALAAKFKSREFDEQVDPVKWLNLDKKTTKALIKYLDNQWAKEVTEKLEGKTPDEKQVIIREHRRSRSSLLSDNQMVDDDLKEMFVNLEGFPIENMDGEELPPMMYVALSYLSDLEETPAGLATHASAKAIAMSDFYKKGKARQLTDVQAFGEAKRMAGTPPATSNTKDEQKKFDSLVSDSIDSAYEHSFYEFWKPSDISDAHKKRFAKDISAYARQLQVENNDPERSVELATKAVLANYTQLPNGSPVYGKPAWLAKEMGLKPNEAIAKLDVLAERIANASVEDGLENLNLNTDIPFNEWIPVISSNGTIRFFDKENNPVTSPLLLSTVGGFTLKQKVKHIADREKMITESRNKRDARRKLSEYREKSLSKYTTDERNMKFL